MDMVYGTYLMRLRGACLIADTEAINPVRRLHYGKAIRGLFFKLKHHARRLAVQGDADCSSNPIDARGMTAAVLQAEALARTLHASGLDAAHDAAAVSMAKATIACRRAVAFEDRAS